MPQDEEPPGVSDVTDSATRGMGMGVGVGVTTPCGSHENGSELNSLDLSRFAPIPFTAWGAEQASDDVSTPTLEQEMALIQSRLVVAPGAPPISFNWFTPTPQSPVCDADATANDQDVAG